jgi:hypothetical protein
MEDEGKVGADNWFLCHRNSNPSGKLKAINNAYQTSYSSVNLFLHIILDT